MDKFLKETLILFADEVETWPGYEEYVPRLRKFNANFMDRAAQCYKLNKPSDGYNVLNHGDFHIKNLLFKHSAEEKLEDMYFVSKTIKIFIKNLQSFKKLLSNLLFFSLISKFASWRPQQLI